MSAHNGLGDRMKKKNDTFGMALLDFYKGKKAKYEIERDDGYIDEKVAPDIYFFEYNKWPEEEKEAMK